MAKKKKLVTGEWSKNEVKVLKKIFGNTSAKEVLLVFFQAMK